MKKMSYFILFIFIFFIFSLDAFAKEIIVVNEYDVRVRSDSTTNSSILGVHNRGDEFNLVDKNGKSGNGCDDKWFKIEYNSSYGYICSSFVDVKTVEEIDINKDDFKDYSEYLKKLGFPDTYITYLVNLHSKHPNWQFKVMNVDANFSDIVNVEYKSNGLSLIEDYNGHSFDGYKSVDSWSYNYLTDIFSTNFIGGGSRWYAANKDTIAYYLDPRNFLDDTRIFMFETLSYNSTYHTIDGVNAMLKGSFMDNKEAADGKTYADAFIEAGIKYNISPYVLISRVIQEVGINGSTIVSGTFSGYEGYYNFYNIKAAGSNNTETIRNGLIYAKSQGWDNPYKAIIGGAVFLAGDYLNCGQDTLYLQKWDMIPPNYGGHQYMQNIQAPYSESYKTYNGYNKIGLIDSSFMFVIPVFKNMPTKTSLPNSGNPNNYLSSLSVNGSYLFKEPSNEKEYSINIDSSTKSLNIAASKVNSGATISGVGTIPIKEDTTIPITVRAANGSVRTYKINVTVNNTSSALDISEILKFVEVKYDDLYIYGLDVGYKYMDIVNRIKEKESKAEVSYLDKSGNEKKVDYIASGDSLKIKTDREEKVYKIIIYGDVNGDGKISSADYVTIKNHIMDVKKMSDYELIAADSNKDGKVSSADYVTIKNHIMDVKKITQ